MIMTSLFSTTQVSRATLSSADNHQQGDIDYNLRQTAKHHGERGDEETGRLGRKLWVSDFLVLLAVAYCLILDTPPVLL